MIPKPLYQWTFSPQGLVVPNRGLSSLNFIVGGNPSRTRNRVIGNGLRFDGVSDFAYINDTAALSPAANDFGAFVWVRWTSTRVGGGSFGENATMFSKGSLSSNRYCWSFGFNSGGGSLFSQIASPGADTLKRYQGGSGLNNGMWHLLGITFVNDVFALWIDGAIVTSPTKIIDQAVLSINNQAVLPAIGAYNGASPSQFFPGDIAWAAYWQTTVPNASQVGEIWNNAARRSLIQESFDNEGADLVTKIPQGWRNGTTTCKIGELTSYAGRNLDRGKNYMQFNGSGTMIMVGVNFDEYAGNGYISYDYFNGSSWDTRSGLLSAPVTGVAYSGRLLTFTSGGAGHRIANIEVQLGVEV